MKPNTYKVLELLNIPHTTKEISSKLGISLEATKTTIYRLRKKGYVKIVDKVKHKNNSINENIYSVSNRSYITGISDIDTEKYDSRVQKLLDRITELRIENYELKKEIYLLKNRYK